MAIYSYAVSVTLSIASTERFSYENEFLVFINARTMREVADFVGEKLAPIEGVAGTVTMFVLKKYKVNGKNMDLKPEIQDDRMIISA